MAAVGVDLEDFVPSLLREVNPPGTNTFADASSTEMTGYLSDAFWEARLDGFLSEWECDDDGIIMPVVGVDGEDIDRESTTLVIIYAGCKVLRNKILNMNTTFRAKAGPVEFETQNSATMLVEILKELQKTKDLILQKSEEYANLDECFDALPSRAYYFSLTADLPHLALPGPVY
jgi:hypothetical protein